MAEPSRLMDSVVKFELVSPTKLVRSEPVDMVVVPCSEGDIGVLPGHAPLIATVRPGVIAIYAGGKVVDNVFVAGGFCEVSSGRCIMLAEEAEPVRDIKRDAAERRLADARAALDAAADADKPAAMRAVKVAEAYLEATKAV